MSEILFVKAIVTSEFLIIDTGLMASSGFSDALGMQAGLWSGIATSVKDISLPTNTTVNDVSVL